MEDRKYSVLMPGGGKGILSSLLQNTQNGIVAQPASYLMGTGILPRNNPDWA